MKIPRLTHLPIRHICLSALASLMLIPSAYALTMPSEIDFATVTDKAALETNGWKPFQAGSANERLVLTFEDSLLKMSPSATLNNQFLSSGAIVDGDGINPSAISLQFSIFVPESSPEVSHLFQVGFAGRWGGVNTFDTVRATFDTSLDRIAMHTGNMASDGGWTPNAWNDIRIDVNGVDKTFEAFLNGTSANSGAVGGSPTGTFERWEDIRMTFSNNDTTKEVWMSDLAVIPEPSSILLMGLAGIAALAFRRRMCN